MTSLRAAVVVGLLLSGAVAATSSGELPQFVASRDDRAVTQCRDPLSYLCQRSSNDSCVAPAAFCDGVDDCDSGWDEAGCDESLPGYEKTSGMMKTNKVYWMSLSKPGCAKLCDNTPGCDGMSFHGVYGRCQLHTASGELRQLNANWTSYSRTAGTSDAVSTRGARYLFDLPEATAETSIGDDDKLLRRPRRQGRWLSRAARSVQCGGQPVFYMPPKKQQATTRIVGGSEVPYGAFPWQVEIKLLKDGHQVHHCGGAVVSSQHVVTAAHCLNGHKKDQFVVVLGDHDLEEVDEMENAYPVDKIIVHPGYTKSSKRHDIAVLKLRLRPGTKSPFNGRTRPVCLPPPFKEPEAGTECVVSGWGLTNPNDDASLASSLRAVRVAIISEKECASPKVYGGKKHYFPDGMMCAGYLRGGVDACGGDSGGPLACKVDGRFQLVGVVSWGDFCAEANKPGIYTRVAMYAEWIVNSMKK